MSAQTPAHGKKPSWQEGGGSTQLWVGSEQFPALWCMSERGFVKSALWWGGMRLSGRFGSVGRASPIE